MTRLEQGTPLQRHLRNRATPAPRLPIQGRIATPGTVVLPPTSRAVEQAKQIRQLLGAVGTTANQAAQVARSIAVEKEREARGEEIFQRAQASEDYRTQLAVDRSNLPDLFNDIPEGVSVEDYVDDLIELRTEGAPKFYQDAYRSGLKPALIASLLQHQEGVQTQARDEVAQIISESVVDADSTEDILAIYNEARQLPTFEGVTDTQLKGTLFLGALKSAAENGDTVRFEAIVGAIGDRFPEQVLDARRVHAAAVDRAEREKAEPGRERFFEAMNDADAGDGSYDTAIEIVGEELKAGNFSEELANQLSSQARTRKRGKITEAIRRAVEQDEQAQRRSSIDAYGITAKNATSSGGLMFAEDVDYAKLDDSIGVIKRDDIIAAVIDQEFSDIDAEIDPTEDPGGNITTKIRFLAQNGGQVYGPWKSLLSGASATITTDMEQIPPVLVHAYELYQLIDNENPHVAGVHATGESRDYYRAVQLLQNELGMDAPAAMIEASRDRNIPASIESSELENAARGVFSKAKNPRQIVGIIGERAKAYIKTTGMGADTALKRAAEDFKDDFTMVNGFAVKTAGRTLPANLPVVAEHVIDWYADQNEYDPDSLTIRSMNNSTWRIADEFGLAIEIFDITHAELNLIGSQLFEKKAAEQREKEIAGRIKADAARRAVMLQKLRSIPLEQGPEFADFQPIDFSAFPASAFDPEPIAEKPDKWLIGRIVEFARRPKPKKTRGSRSKANLERFQFN